MRKLCFLLIFLCAMSFLTSLSFKEAKATTLTISRAFQSTIDDGVISRYDVGAETYTDIWNAASGAIDDATSQINVGQWDLLEIYRAFLPFDTSSLSDGCTVTSVDLSIRLAVNLSSQDFNVTVQNGMPNHPNLPLQSGDYYKGFYSGAGGSRNTSTLTMNYWNITLNSTGLGWINVDGMTKLCLRSDREIQGIEPTTYEFIAFYSAEQGSAYAPKLYVTYETEGYRYIVHGPYYENGAVAPCLANITLAIQNMDSNNTYLNGTDGAADTLTFENEQQGVSLSWNISASGYNYTRMIRLTDATFEELYIFIPNSGEVVNIYSFNFWDLLGTSNGFFETRITFNGSSVVLERQIADTFSSKPFWLIWNHHYDVRLTCDQGSKTWPDQVALEQYTWTFAVNAGTFPTTLPGMNLTILHERKNHTSIQVNYSDAESLTSWVNVIFRHKLHGNYVTDYSLNQTGNSVQVNWNGADEDYGYRITVQYYRNATLETGYLFANQLPSDELLFEGQLDILGLFPFDSRQIVGILILFIIGTIFTYADVVIGGFTILILASFLNLIGFLAIGWTLIGVGFIVVFLAALAGMKKEGAYG